MQDNISRRGLFIKAGQGALAFALSAFGLGSTKDSAEASDFPEEDGLEIDMNVVREKTKITSPQEEWNEGYTMGRLHYTKQRILQLKGEGIEIHSRLSLVDTNSDAAKDLEQDLIRLAGALREEREDYKYLKNRLEEIKRRRSHQRQ